MTDEFKCGAAVDPLFLESEFVRAYKEAFGGPPYNETYTDQQVLDILHQHQRDGIAMHVSHNEHLIGFGCALPFDKSPQDVKAFLEGLHSEGRLPDQFDFRNAWYMSELGVLNEYRGKGAAWELVWQRMLSASRRGATQFFMRTDWPNSNSMPMYIKCGAQPLADLQDLSGSSYDEEINTQSLHRVYLWGDCRDAANRIKEIQVQKGYIPFDRPSWLVDE